ncbi:MULTISPECIES: TcpE family conjugal transfer membrane protein [unclassified Nocardiopsis]|uniref:TcpE family conjugal transfer membrane protein n=1 Tax=unclassified Nocardiopsis TaxID=2649073 RepID=UPI00135C9FA6|nr:MULTISPECIES: TcpE family conjugal transfer membrane protein [unclassified Nocardiopsis]
MSHPEGAPDQHTLVGRSYTRARRHPWVIGRIQGWTLPLGPFSATQLGVLVISLWLLLQTAPMWTRLGPFALVPLIIPFIATWAVRHAQIEGRAPLRALGGYLALYTAPRRGTLHGRPIPTPDPVRLSGVITIQPTPDNHANPTDEQDVSEAPQWAPRPRATTLRDLLTIPAPAPDPEEEG